MVKMNVCDVNWLSGGEKIKTSFARVYLKNYLVCTHQFTTTLYESHAQLKALPSLQPAWKEVTKAIAMEASDPPEPPSE